MADSLWESWPGLRAEVRSLVATWDFVPRSDAWLRSFDPAFSRELAAPGLVAMTYPAEYRGGGRTHVERLVVTEELLRAGAPVAAHWIGEGPADRAVDPAARVAGAPQGVPAADRLGARGVLSGDERAGRRVRPGGGAHGGDALRGRRR
ncbi:acyl-CoA dehydrogenase family protein [Streptomyces sp. NPDC058247]|uniref:acyl-CoA dehydrogenase family protein n=1 Tax=Streptomyces sp. NPDC058247 TaxID=3346401 RepID=UPI0036E6C2E2